MVGAPGSGKTYWLNNHKKEIKTSYAIISRDVIRFSMLKEGDEYFSKEKEVYKEFISQIKTSLANNEETYVDATHLNLGSRAKLLSAIDGYNDNIEIHAIVIKRPLDIILAQNAQRTGRALVPETAVKNMYASYVRPDAELEQINYVWELDFKTNKLKMIDYWEG